MPPSPPSPRAAPPAQPSAPMSWPGVALAAALLIVALLPCTGASWAAQPETGAVSRPADPILQIRSASALIIDDKGRRLYGKNTDQVRPIASITKLMTAMVVLDAGVPLGTPIGITDQDRDRMRNSRSRLRVGEAALSRRDMLTVALMSSDNRAAAALARTTFPAGTRGFVDAMNRKAQTLGMSDSWFADATGLDDRNRSTAEDLVKLIRAAAEYRLIREATTRGELSVYPFADSGPLEYRNTNPLVRNPTWHVELSKTGFINESGHCLVMRTRIGGRRLDVVLLDAVGKLTPVGDSNRLRTWLVDGRRIAEN